MTGTPVANRPYDIWAQIYFLDQGMSLGNDFKEFKRQTDLSNKLSKDKTMQEDFEHVVSNIHGKIKAFSVRETKNSGIIELPDKVYICENAEFYPEQKALYDRIREELKIEVKKDGRLVEDDSSAIVKRLLRLIQVTSNPFLVDESYRGRSAKEKVLDNLLQKILMQGEKCIVWTSFIDNVERFTKAYSDYGCIKIHGGMKIIDRNRSVDRFRTEDYRILFATPAAAKEGLTLTMANHVIFYDRGFSLDDYLQAQDRIHRISQEKACYIHNIIMKDSIDEWVDVLLKAKQNAASLAQGDTSLDEYRDVADYSFGDLIKAILFPDDKGEEDYEQGHDWQK
jgi:SNF2 family DNA or RNA helicase